MTLRYNAAIPFGYNYIIFSEWRALLVAFGPMVITSIPPGPIRRLWAHFIYLARWLILSKEEEEAENCNVAKSSNRFLTLFEKYIGQEYMSYNVHALHHVEKLRLMNESANRFSTFAFEAMYSQLVAALCAGIISIF